MRRGLGVAWVMPLDERGLRIGICMAWARFVHFRDHDNVFTLRKGVMCVGLILRW